ncbi:MULTISPECIES: ArsR/SmtB family transcription factor [Pseudomonadota]|uniref:ArsR/SmtB family transcription factor n=1 Tax=Pseudomonadota TaxID=1224 RepID=UPI00155A4D14|nr:MULTISPECIES: metalloregulator ArsR/SmtB family transcription factor [Pseudomonadota]MCA8495464.1 metalloregulator ArsR/SmtB family transcription factor [Burkholderia arboris]MDA8259652.1 metalloregulator ArsR/SmtB family transcription factor [Betaproteobacteria bacterium]
MKKAGTDILNEGALHPRTVSPSALRRKAEQMAKLCRGLSDPSRLSILEALRSRTLTVSEIVKATGMTQSNVSNHLGCLYDCGLVRRDQEGRFVRYRLSDPRVEMLLRLSEELLADTARGVIGCTEIGPHEDGV